MSTANSDNARDQAEAIFTNVSQALEKVLIDYRQLFLSDTDDPVQESVFALIDELEALKKKIGNSNEKITLRIDSVGNIATYIEDAVTDIGDYKKYADSLDENPFLHPMEALVTVFGRPYTLEKSAIEDNFLNQSQISIESFFKSKKAELDALLTKYPELKQ